MYDAVAPRWVQRIVDWRLAKGHGAGHRKIGSSILVMFRQPTASLVGTRIYVQTHQWCHCFWADLF